MTSCKLYEEILPGVNFSLNFFPVLSDHVKDYVTYRLTISCSHFLCPALKMSPRCLHILCFNRWKTMCEKLVETVAFGIYEAFVYIFFIF